MKLSKLKILGKEYKVSFVPTIEAVNTSGTDQKLFGQIEYVGGSIRIFGGLKEFDTLQVLFHEIVHSISTSLSLDFDEKVIDLVAFGIANVLIDNKMLKE